MSDTVSRRRLSLIPADVASRTLVVLLIAVIMVFGLTLGGGFLNIRTFQSMAFQIPQLGILSLGMMVTLLCGGVNLSLIATANVTGLTIAFLLSRAGPSADTAAILGAVLGGFAVAGAIGLLNGALVAYIGVSPILATLGTMTLLKGLAVGFTRGGILSGFPPAILAVGNSAVLGVPTAALIFAIVAMGLSVLLKRTPFGVRLYMIGSNEEATRYSGVDTRRTLLMVYVLSSLLAAIAAVIMMARFNSTNASYGESYLLITILAAVLGGVDPFGGFGRVIGLVLALVVLQTVSSGMNAMGVNSHLTVAIWGLILIGTVGFPLIRSALSPLLTRKKRS
jgi:simple sugar transport system permease protein